MSNYYILTNKRPKPKFEVHFNCMLLDGTGFPTPSPFNQLETVIEKGYQLKVLPKGREIGKIRDKLSVTIQNNEHLLVVSEKLKTLLSELQEQMEFHPATLLKDKEKLISYYIVNIIQHANAIDYENSTLIFWDESHQEVYNIDELVLNPKVIPQEYNIFLLEKIKGVPVIVISEKLKTQLEDNNITGLNLYKPKNLYCKKNEELATTKVLNGQYSYSVAPS